VQDPHHPCCNLLVFFSANVGAQSGAFCEAQSPDDEIFSSSESTLWLYPGCNGDGHSNRMTIRSTQMLNEDLDQDASTTVRELTIEELEAVSGGTTFPPDPCQSDCGCCKK
jgi:hypothetical protein